MNYNMNLERTSHNTTSKRSKTKSQGDTASNSSNYSTCSDNPIDCDKQNLQLSRESVILAGQIGSNQPNSNTVLEDTNVSISLLDLNVDENDEVFKDCEDISYSESHNDSTIYLPIQQVVDSKKSESDLTNNNSSSNQIAAVERRLLTIIEEREVTNTTDHMVKDLSPKDPNENTGLLMVDMVDQIKTHKEPNNNLTRKVLFANLDDVVDNQNKLNLQKTSKLSDNHHGRSRKANDTCNHNTTESFVLWENFCQASEELASRRSFSWSQLYTANESCSGDDEYSTSCKTLDDTQLSNSYVETQDYNKDQSKGMIYRSKSCESVLNEVKHLPHLLYDRFFKYLSEEIERIRKENVKCTCQKSHKKNANKENNRKRSLKKPILQLTNKITNVESAKAGSRLPLQVNAYTGVSKNNKLLPNITNSKCLSPTPTTGMRLSPEPTMVNRTRLSPETSSKNLSLFQTSPKSPIRTTPSKSRYFWNKQIVSPVGE